jgi:hypothetical protein
LKAREENLKKLHDNIGHQANNLFRKLNLEDNRASQDSGRYSKKRISYLENQNEDQ